MGCIPHAAKLRIVRNHRMLAEIIFTRPGGPYFTGYYACGWCCGLARVTRVLRGEFCISMQVPPDLILRLPHSWGEIAAAGGSAL